MRARLVENLLQHLLPNDGTCVHKPTSASAGSSADKIDVLIIGGRGTIGAGLRTYLPRLGRYAITALDLPGSDDKAELNGDYTPEIAKHTTFVNADFVANPSVLKETMVSKDLVVYLARGLSLEPHKVMTDLVFKTLLSFPKPPMIVAASSVHATDGLYTVNFGQRSILAERRFDKLKGGKLPPRISSHVPATTGKDGVPSSDPDVCNYSLEKKYVEDWCIKTAARGVSAVAARWGGINPHNRVYWGPGTERGYFALFCHQEDAARFVHAAYSTCMNGNLISGSHYYVVSDNTYNIFDVEEVTKKEIGYMPLHNAEDWMGPFGAR